MTQRAGIELSGKRAVVTGAGSGIGKAIALALASRRCDVLVADIDADRAAAVASAPSRDGGRLLAAACDVADRASVEALADRAWRELGGVDLLVNNAGVLGGGPLLDAKESDLRWVFEVNVLGVWNGCAVFGRRFLDAGDPAWILNTGSEHSFGFVHPAAGFYTASKHAVLGLSDVLRRELGGRVGVSVLCPGIVRTDIWESTERRHARFGGPEAGAPVAQALMAEGMDPDEVARRAIAGVERGEFLIPTHSHARRYAEERWHEIAGAFDRQAPHRPGDERYDVMRMIEALQRSR